MREKEERERREREEGGGEVTDRDNLPQQFPWYDQSFPSSASEPPLLLKKRNIHTIIMIIGIHA